MCTKFQSFARPGSARMVELPDNVPSEADEQGILRAGNFESNEQIQGEILLADGDETNTEFTGKVIEVNDGRIETFKITSLNSIIPELSEVVRLSNLNFYRITSVD